jgi:hypothetical protein
VRGSAPLVVECVEITAIAGDKQEKVYIYQHTFLSSVAAGDKGEGVVQHCVWVWSKSMQDE